MLYQVRMLGWTSMLHVRVVFETNMVMQTFGGKLFRSFPCVRLASG